jgi:hypothetical protein
MKHISFKIYIVSLIVTISAASCQKVIDLKLGTDTGRLVIEGNLTNVNGTQTVKLSRNVSFYSTNDYPVVSGAKVTVNDAAGHLYSFREGAAGTYSYTPLRGERNRAYTLTATVNGQTYTATSTMPAQVMLDSLGYEDSEFNNDGRKNIVVYYADPIGVNNYYRFVEYVNNVEVKETFAYDDNFSDGQRIGMVLRQDDIPIRSGAMVTVEMQCIDKNVFTYWYALRQQQIAGGLSGVTPADPPTNLSNNALGYFSVHTSQTKSIIIR